MVEPRFTVESDVNVRVKLDQHLIKAKNAEAVYVVEYLAHYAIYVHEATHVARRNGQAKFLEQPARENGTELGKIVGTVAKTTGDVADGLRKAAITLLKISQPLVPVLTGKLKKSGRVRREK